MQGLIILPQSKDQSLEADGASPKSPPLHTHTHTSFAFLTQLMGSTFHTAEKNCMDAFTQIFSKSSHSESIVYDGGHRMRTPHSPTG